MTSSRRINSGVSDKKTHKTKKMENKLTKQDLKLLIKGYEVYIINFDDGIGDFFSKERELLKKLKKQLEVLN